ncbi:MAG: hypothetical protein R3290_09535 [Acidimicrobiia bacterium]|nr:hypothetical protein [Acidimicrobiia bacterium]
MTGRLGLAIGILLGGAVAIGIVFRLAHDPRAWSELHSSTSDDGITAVVEQDARLDEGPTAVRVVLIGPEGDRDVSHVFFVSNGGAPLPPDACTTAWSGQAVAVTCDGALQDPATRRFEP